MKYYTVFILLQKYLLANEPRVKRTCVCPGMVWFCRVSQCNTGLNSTQRSKIIIEAKHSFPPHPSIHVLLYQCQCIHHTALRTSVTSVFMFTAIGPITSRITGILTSTLGYYVEMEVWRWTQFIYCKWSSVRSGYDSTCSLQWFHKHTLTHTQLTFMLLVLMLMKWINNLDSIHLLTSPLSIRVCIKVHTFSHQVCFYRS